MFSVQGLEITNDTNEQITRISRRGCMEDDDNDREYSETRCLAVKTAGYACEGCLRSLGNRRRPVLQDVAAILIARRKVSERSHDEVFYRELSYQVMRAVFHNTLGPGFVESAYEEALAYELEQRGIPFERQKGVTVRYKGRVVGTHRLDFVVDGKIVLALKAVSARTNVFKQQALSYLKATGLRLAFSSTLAHRALHTLAS